MSPRPTDPGPPRLAEQHDVVVVGAGPAGAAAAHWLARAGWDVLLLERKRFPRAKTCGDGLTPRAVRQLADMGLLAMLEGHHRYDGLRAVGFGRSMELSWPAHPELPSHGYVVQRSDLDLAVADRAVAMGATLRQGIEASPLRSASGRVVGVQARDLATASTSSVGARYVVVADGSNSRFGRALGTSRVREWPMGLAIRGYWRSPRSDEPWIESRFDLRDDSGAILPGYGWTFPLGDGRVNVGVGLLSTSDRWKGVNTSKLLDAYVAQTTEAWGLEPDPSSPPPTGGKLPMGFSVAPRVGDGWLAAGDAAGSINPFNGEGIAYGYETGRLAAWAVGQALSGGDAGALAAYEGRLEAAYGDYFRLGRLFVRLIGRPPVMRAAIGAGMRSQPLMSLLLRVMANLMRPGWTGAPEVAYRAAAALAGRLDHEAEERPAA